MKFDSSKFLEPSEKYIKHIRFSNAKLWYNLDLIHIIKSYKDSNQEEKNKLYDFYNDWLKSMEIKESFEEIYNRFSNYSKKDFENLMKYVMKKAKII